MAQASRDENSVPTLIAAANTDGVTPVRLYADPVTHRLLVDMAGGGTGTVTSVSVATANGFAGTVADPTTTPEITIETTVTGILLGDGTAVTAAVANTDYQIPIILTTTGTSGAATFDGETLNIPNYTNSATIAGSIADTQIAYGTAANTIAGEQALVWDYTNNFMGILATSGIPTHSLTLGSTGNGIALYNTADQVSAYERLQIGYSSNIGQLQFQRGAGGSARILRLAQQGASSAYGVFDMSYGVGSTNFMSWYIGSNSTYSGTNQFNFGAGVGSLTASSSTQNIVAINTPIAQTSTAGYTALLINPTETTTGSGAKNLILAQVGGVEKFSVANTGNMTSTNNSGTNTFNLVGAVSTLTFGAASGGPFFGSLTNHDLRILTNNIEIARFQTSTGNFGINNANPGAKLDVVNSTDTASVQVARFQGDRATPAASDEVYESFYLSSSTGTQREFSRITTIGTTVTNTSEVGVLQFSVMVAGTLTSRFQLTSTAIRGTANDIIALGSAGVAFSDLYLASGALIDFANGNSVITHSSGILTVSTGDLRVTTAGTNSASVVTNAGTQTITNKRNQPRTASSTTASTLTPDLSSANVYYRTTQTATLTIEAPIGTPVIGETIAIYVDSAGAQTLTMNATYIPFGAAFPATTTAGKTLMITAQYNGTNWKTLWANAV